MTGGGIVKKIGRLSITASSPAAAGIKRVLLSLINTKMSCIVNLADKECIMYHVKHQKTVRAINRAKHKQAQNLAKRAKRLDCKLTMNVIFVSRNSIVI